MVTTPEHLAALLSHLGLHFHRTVFAFAEQAVAARLAEINQDKARGVSTWPIVDDVERNEFVEKYRGPGDDFFGGVGSKPEILPISTPSPSSSATSTTFDAVRVETDLGPGWATSVEQTALDLTPDRPPGPSPNPAEAR